jgi:cell division protein FtsB
MVPAWTAALAVFVAATGIAVLDTESGIRTWLDLREEARLSSARIETLEHEVERLTREIDALESDELALERAIREDLELARPGEWVVRFAASDPTPGTAGEGLVDPRFP